MNVFSVRAAELAGTRPELTVAVEPCSGHAGLQIADLDGKVMRLARNDAQVRRSAAAQEKVDVFHRFALMQYWHERKGIPFEAFLSPDGLHMNDWGYSCFAKALANAIADAAGLDQTSRKDNLESKAATTGKAH